LSCELKRDHPPMLAHQDHGNSRRDAPCG
jgi:hypothetical protein